MAAEKDLIFAALESGDYDTAFPLMQSVTIQESSQLISYDNRTPLHYACQHGRVDMAEYLLSYWKFSIEERDKKGFTPLHLAAEYGQLEVIKHILNKLFFDKCLKYNTTVQQNKNLTAIFRDMLLTQHRDALGNSLLYTAFIHNHHNVVYYLIQKLGFNCDYDGSVLRFDRSFFDDENYRDCDLQHLSFLATEAGLLDIMKYLIEKRKARVGISRKDLTGLKYQLPGRSLLHVASCGGHLDVIRYLVGQQGCYLRDKDSKGCTPLHLACAYGRSEAVLYYAKIRPLAAMEKDNSGNIPLHYASGKGLIELVRFFIENMDCFPTTTNKYRRVPLHNCSQNGYLDVVKYFVEEHHCNPLQEDQKGFTPFHAATANGHLHLVKYFCVMLKNRGQRAKNFNSPPLHYAARNGHLEVVMFLIEDMKHDSNSFDTSGRLALHHASKHGHINVVKLLVSKYHSDPLHGDQNLLTPFHFAAANGQFEVTKFFIDILRLNTEVEDVYCKTPLHYASCNGHLNVIKLFTGVNCYQLQSKLGRIPLHCASQNGHLEVVKYFVERCHCDPLCQDYNKFTPLHLAASNGQLQIVKYLTNTLNVQVSQRDAHSQTSLHHAALYGHLDVVKFLIEHKNCDPFCTDKLKRTPLHHASENGQLPVVKYLIHEHHCNPMHRDLNKFVPLILAAANGQLEVVKYFINTLKVDPNVKDAHAQNSLHHAALQGHLKVVKFLIEDVKLEDKCPSDFGRIALHYASQNGHLGVVKYLCDKNDVCDKHDNIPLHLAAFNGQLEVVRYFTVDCGVNPFKKNLFSQTSLFLAVKAGHLEVVTFLTLTHRINPHTHPHSKRLFEAAKDPTILEYLKRYTDPLHHAAIIGDLETVKDYVEKKKWDPLLTDRHGNSALDNAKNNGRAEVVTYLKKVIEDISAFKKKEAAKTTIQKSALEEAEQAIQYIAGFLLGDTNYEPFNPYALQPSITFFVLGNSGSGKSTLSKALLEEKSLFGRFIKVKGVKPLTPGIEPFVFHSEVLGKVNIYDFSGHEEYYASHEMILCQTSSPIILLVVRMDMQLHELEQQVLYWLYILSNSSAVNNYMSMHVMVIGSHADKLHNEEEKDQIFQSLTKLLDNEPTINNYGIFALDCRYSTSSQLRGLRQNLSYLCKEIRENKKFRQNDYSNILCASLMHYIQYYVDSSEQPTISIERLRKQIKKTKWLNTKFPGPSLIKLTDDLELFYSTCTTLSSEGHILLLLDQSMDKSLLVLNEKVILSNVHACLSTIKNKISNTSNLSNSYGLLEESQLHMILQESLSKFMKPKLAVTYLLITQFCTQISSDQLEGISDQKRYYFFPNLVFAARPNDLLSTEDSRYSGLYTWCLKCADSSQFFTPRFLHTLFIQLIKYEDEISAMSKHTVWKNGIFFVHSNGTRFVIEITDQTTRLLLTMQCKKGCGPQLVQQRSMLIHLIKSLTRKVCPRVKLEEILLDTQSFKCYPVLPDVEIPVKDLAMPIFRSHKCVVSMKGDIPQHNDLTELILFDSFQNMDEFVIAEIFAYQNSKKTVPPNTLRNVCEAVSMIDTLVKHFRHLAEQSLLTYSHLYTELHKHTVFTDGDLCSLAGVEVNQPTSQLLPSLISTLSPSAQRHLNDQPEFHEICDISHHMLGWEEKLSVALKLDEVDISDIKDQNPFKPQLQRREALKRWSEKEGLNATYMKLLQIFTDTELMKCAEATCNILKNKFE